MPLHEGFSEEFARWILPALPGADGDLIMRRWAAVSPTAERVGESALDTLNVARLLYALPVDPDAAEGFRSDFLQHDPQMARGAANLEVQLLAGSTLSALMRGEHPMTAVAILAVLAGDAASNRRNEWNSPFYEIAAKQRRRRATRNDSADSWPALTKETASTLANVSSISDTAAIDIARFIVRLDGFGREHLRRLEEEADIAWWVLGEYSRDLRIPVRNLDKRACPIILAKELADLTRTTLGPVASYAIFSRMLSLQKRLPGSISFTDAIEILPVDWATNWFKNFSDGGLGMLTPVLSGVMRKLSAGGPEWQDPFVRDFGCRASCAPDELAQQVYVECLLMRALGDRGE